MPIIIVLTILTLTQQFGPPPAAPAVFGPPPPPPPTPQIGSVTSVGGSITAWVGTAKSGFCGRRQYRGPTDTPPPTR